jgi:hypothetical protein
MGKEKYHSFDIETYHAMKYADIDTYALMLEIINAASRPCNTDPIEEELDNRILLA